MPHRALFCDSLRFWGGGEHWNVLVASALARRGWDVCVSGRPGAPILERAQQNGLAMQAWSYRTDFDPLTIGQALRYIRRERPDVVLVTVGRDVRTVGVAARMGGIPVVWVMGMPLPNHGWAHRFSGRHLVSRIVVPSHDLKRQLQPFVSLNGKVAVIPNGTDAIPPTPSETVSARSALGWSADDVVVLFAGRLARRKGVDTLLRAFASLIASAPRGRCVIVGSGEQENGLRKLADELRLNGRVDFLGHRHDVGRFYDACDLVVVPSRIDTFPFVMLEAMGRGRPVVATPVGGIPELAGEDGAMLIPPNDPPALADALRVLIDDPGRRRSLGEAGLRRVLTHFTEAQMIDRVEGLLNELIAKRTTTFA